ncbi:MAG: hypothetical protein GC189_10135 [Alphaproteobacteria bacterium]|nr:hypothetical protein [Alphaproteobacteria bacterium]
MCRPYSDAIQRLAGAIALAPTLCGASFAQEPWRLQDALGAPDWLILRGEARQRLETLDGQFRAGGQGSDQALAMRTLLLAEADAGFAAFGVEAQDARVYLDDAGTPLSVTLVNPLDVLQAYARFDFSETFADSRVQLTIGRQTLDIESRRVLEREDFANAMASYTGAYWRMQSARGDALHLIYVAPVGRRPSDFAGLADNDLSADEEEWGRRLWGVHARRAEAFGALAPRTSFEAFVYGLQEEDRSGAPAPNRDYVQPGFRINREPRAGAFDIDLEASYRTGQRRLTADASDTRDLDVRAWTLHADAGYSFDHPWRPRLSLDFDYASGDEDPNDDRFDQYERLFGTRRTDLGNSSIHGPLTPANLSAPGARIEIAPSERFDARLAYKAAFLASATDAWVVARVRDPSGASGRFIGHAIDARTRYTLVPGNLQMEVGGSVLLAGDFADRAPNASRQGDTHYAYVMFTQTF